MLPKSMFIWQLYGSLYGLTHIYVTASDLQLEALKQLYYNTNGDQWKHNGNWSVILQNIYNTTSALCDSTGCASFDTCSAMYGVYCYLNTITEIKLGNNSLSGTIDSSVCDLLTNDTSFFSLSYNNISGRVPDCVLPVISSLHNRIQKTTYFDLYRNQLTGSLSFVCDNMIPNIDHITTGKSLNFANNLLSGTIPECLTRPFGYIEIEFANNLFSGGIPSNWSVPNLNLNNNTLTGNVPNDMFNPMLNNFFYAMSSPIMMDLSNNQLSGTLSFQLIDNINQLINDYQLGNEFYLQLSNNKFDYFDLKWNISNSTDTNDGIIGAIFLHDNNFKNNNIDQILNQLFSRLNIKYLTFHNNSQLTGNIGLWKQVNKQLKILTLHDCNIGGKLSHHITLLEDIEYITLYNNRLSCQIYPNMVEFNNEKIETNMTSIALLGNLFEINKLNQIELLNNDPFTSALNLYINKNSFFEYLQISYLIIAAVFGLGFICYKLKLLVVQLSTCVCCKSQSTKARKNENRDRSRVSLVTSESVNDINNNSKNNYTNKSEFLNIIDLIFKLISSWFIIFVVVVLTTIYYTMSNYYECGHTTSKFSLTYYYINVNNHNNDYDDKYASTSQIVMTLFVVLFNGYVVFNLKKLIETKKMKIKQFMQLQAQAQSHDDKFEEKLKLVENDNGGIGKGMGVRIHNVWLVFCFGLLYIFGNIVSIAYVVTHTLPNNNRLGINDKDLVSRYLINYGVAFTISIVSVYVVPYMIDYLFILTFKCHYNNNFYQYRSFLIFCLRSFVTIIPFVTSLIILPKCGNQWTLLWRDCDIKNKANFDQTLTIEIQSQFTYHVTVQLSSYHSICGANNYNNFIHNYDGTNRCLRSFFDLWAPIITAKLVFYAINPFIIYTIRKYNVDQCFRSIVVKVCNVCGCTCCGWIRKKRKEHFYFETEYAVIATKLELCFIFTPIMPYVMLLIIFAVLNNCIVYSWVMYDLKWQLVGGFHTRNRYTHAQSSVGDQDNSRLNDNQIDNLEFWVQFPFYGLFVSIMLGQLLFIAFSLDILPNLMFTIFCIAILIIDTIFIVNQVYQSCFLKRN